MQPEWDKHATQYTFKEGPRDRFVIEARNFNAEGIPNSWAVACDGFVLCTKVWDFVYEPFPSSRTTEFLESTRFTSREAAWEALQTYRLTPRKGESP
jgi:hypothetical protein